MRYIYNAALNSPSGLQILDHKVYLIKLISEKINEPITMKGLSTLSASQTG
jgi:hypothetical protein